MKKKLLLLIMFTTILLASNEIENETEKKARIAKQLQVDLKKEKKYAKEQVFYTEENYDFSSAEVNPDSLDSIQELENQDDFDMDDVYD